MSAWEYATVEIRYERKQKTWVVAGQALDGVTGVPAILQAYGRDGWELVSLAAERQQAFPVLGGWRLEPESYRATFKRPRS
jgi:hypothetical protein